MLIAMNQSQHYSTSPVPDMACVQIFKCTLVMCLIQDLDLKENSDSSFFAGLRPSPQKPDFTHPSDGFESVLGLTKRTWVV